MFETSTVIIIPAVSTFHDRFSHIRMTPHRCQVSFPPTLLTLCRRRRSSQPNSVFHYIRLNTFMLNGISLSFNHLMLPKVVIMLLKIHFTAFVLLEVTLHLYYSSLINSYKLISILQWLCSPTFMMDLVAPTNNKHKKAMQACISPLLARPSLRTPP